MEKSREENIERLADTAERIAAAAERIASIMERLLEAAESEGGPIAQSGPNPPGGNPGPNH